MEVNGTELTPSVRLPCIDKLQPAAPNLSLVINFRPGCVHGLHICCNGVKLPSLKLKTRPKQLERSLLLDIALPV